MNKLRTLLHNYREILSYVFWGVLTTVVSWGSFSLFELILNSITAANIISWICAVLFAFVTNKLWVFESSAWAASVVFPQLVKFFVSRLATGVLEIAGVPLLVKLGINQSIFGVDGMAAKIIVSVAVMILNYVFSKLLVFRHKNASNKN